MDYGWLILAGVMVGVGVVFYFLVVWGMAKVMLRPPRMTDGKAVYVLRRLSPGDMGLGFEEVGFEVKDEKGGRIHIAGWWIPCEQAEGRCAILIHGYSDAKVGAIAWAPLFHDLKMNILAVDLRAHGESGGRYSTAGYFEREDMNQVIEQIKQQRPGETQRIVLFGVSLGAAVALATAGLRKDISAVIVDSPFADYRRAADTHASVHGLPGGMFQKGAMKLAQWISGADFSKVRPVDWIREISCPLMVIQSGEDPFVSAEDAAAVRAATESRPLANGPTEYWRVEGAGHVLGWGTKAAEYRERVAGFLKEN